MNRVVYEEENYGKFGNVLEQIQTLCNSQSSTILENISGMDYILKFNLDANTDEAFSGVITEQGFDFIALAISVHYTGDNLEAPFVSFSEKTRTKNYIAGDEGYYDYAPANSFAGPGCVTGMKLLGTSHFIEELFPAGCVIGMKAKKSPSAGRDETLVTVVISGIKIPVGIA